MADSIVVPAVTGIVIAVLFILILATVIDTNLANGSIGVFRAEGDNGRFQPERYPHVSISIEGLKEAYHAGESITFTAYIKGFVPSCDTAPTAKIIQAGTNKVIYSYDPYMISLCEIGFFENESIPFGNPDEGSFQDAIAIHDGGQYKLVVEKYGDMAEKGFIVLRSDSGVGISGELVNGTSTIDDVDSAVDNLGIIIYSEELTVNVTDSQ